MKQKRNQKKTQKSDKNLTKGMKILQPNNNNKKMMIE